MKKAIILLVGLVVILSGSINFYETKRTEAVSVIMNLRDMPTHNIRLIGPSDPSYNGRIASMLKGRQNEIVEAIKPYAVFLENNNKKAIVAFAVKWDMTRPDGTTISRPVMGLNPTPLMDGGEPGTEEIARTSGQAIKPGSSKFISTMLTMDEEPVNGIIGMAGGTTNEAAAKELEEAAKNKDVGVMLKHATAELRSYPTMTVSIDGIFFEDGTFIGPNTTQFFEKTVAGVDAKLDLLNEINFARKHNRLDEIFTEIDALANSTTNAGETPTDYYNRHKKMYAQGIVRLRKMYGDEKAVRITLSPLGRQWVELRKE